MVEERWTVSTDYLDIEHKCCFEASLFHDGERVAEFIDAGRATEVAKLLNEAQTAVRIIDDTLELLKKRRSL